MLNQNQDFLSCNQPSLALKVEVGGISAVRPERLQTDKILASTYFAKSERLRRFLDFVVSAKLRGEASILKESVLAIEVFDRDSSYDSRVDSVVRVQASRLRLKLQDYYRNEGARDLLEITLPKGSYVPEFQRREVAERLPVPVKPGWSTQPKAATRFWVNSFTAAWKVSVFVTQILLIWALLRIWHQS